LEWPFRAIVDDSGGSTGWCALTGPLRTERAMARYRRLTQEFRFIGFTSYTMFPAVAEGVAPDYTRLCEAWCHCFRDPDRYIGPGASRALISESDFVDWRILARTVDARTCDGKDFDFAYLCLPGAWKERTKNWELAKRCLPRLCGDLDLKGLLLGRWQILDLPFRRNLTVVGDLRQAMLWEHLCRSRLLFVPSVMDASPRILAEALCLDVPILVNRAILGGWKYVTPSTGAFFDSEDDVAEAAWRCLNTATQPRQWFAQRYGPACASARLADFIREREPALPAGAACLPSRSVRVAAS
jgi:glycosyltransferase involved in cell wall biosynthesis